MSNDTRIENTDTLFGGTTNNNSNQQYAVVSLHELHPFRGHPFRVVRDAEMDKLVESVRGNGVITPAIVRPLKSGGYEIISGHRRAEASRLAGKSTIPAMICEVDDNAAVIAMVESNLKQRERLLPSERAKSYRMLRDALAHQGIALAPDPTQRKQTKDEIAERFGESSSKVMRTIRLTYLNEPLLDMVDAEKLKIGLATQISYLDTEVQCWITDYYEKQGAWPSSAQVRELRYLYEQGKLTQDAFRAVMEQQAQSGKKDAPHPSPRNQKPQQDDFFLKIIDDYFPGLTIDDVKEKIIELIEQYKHRKRMEEFESRNFVSR